MSAWNPSKRIHDFSRRGWGHDYIFDPVDGGLRARVSGWCWPKPVEGDYLILQHPEGGTTRYRVEAVKHPSAQGDQFFADVVFAPREADT